MGGAAGPGTTRALGHLSDDTTEATQPEAGRTGQIERVCYHGAERGDRRRGYHDECTEVL